MRSRIELWSERIDGTPLTVSVDLGWKLITILLRCLSRRAARFGTGSLDADAARISASQKNGGQKGQRQSH